MTYNLKSDKHLRIHARISGKMQKQKKNFQNTTIVKHVCIIL